MPASDQHTAGRYTVVPRTLVFIERDAEVLLLRGGNHKWFAGQYNGIGGHVEPEEDVMTAAAREVVEETGLTPGMLTLVAVIHIVGDAPGVLLFVFRGSAEGIVRSSDEGVLEWVPVDKIDTYPLVPDLYWLLPRALNHRGQPFFATARFQAEYITIRTAAGEEITVVAD